MRSFNYFDDKYISPKQMTMYLEQSGWNKKKEAEDISAWIYSKNDKKVGIFVPLTDDFVDYRERTLEVLDTLEQVERRSKYEIIQDIINTSSPIDESTKQSITL